MCHICLLRSFLDWLFFGFDDTDWPNATEYQMNEDRFREIDPSASFIFVADDHSSGYHYCRKNIGLIFLLAMLVCAGMYTLIVRKNSTCSTEQNERLKTRGQRLI